MTLIDLVL